MSYQGPVFRIREAMERERAAVALSGQTLESPDSCQAAQKTLRAALLTPWSPIVGPCRPWRLGTDMVGPKWLWTPCLARVVNDPVLEGSVQVWTRKAHRAWRREQRALSTVAAAILRGEVTDRW
jgi:hypothetical protein